MRPEPRCALAILGFAITLAGAGPARADEPTTRPPVDLVVGPDFGAEPGAMTVTSLGRLAWRYEELLPLGAARPSRDQAPLWVLDRLAWIAKTILVDIPLADLQAVTIHEVFGHGARARELGFRVGYSFKLPFPYGPVLAPGDDDYEGLTSYQERAPKADDAGQLFTTGGVEANAVTARLLARTFVGEGGWAHHGELMVYGASKLAYAARITAPSFRQPGGPVASSNDAESYVSNLQVRFGRVRADERATIAKRVQTAYYWHFADPLLVWSVWAELVDVLAGSQRYARAPLPRVLGADFLPLPRVWLAPHGVENELSVLAKGGDWLVEGYGRVGTTGLARSWGAGASLEDRHDDRRVRLGAAVDVWRQPALDLERRAFFDRPSLLGGSLSATLRLRVLSGAGLLGKAGYKTDGWLPGQRADAGAYGFLGLYVEP